MALILIVTEPSKLWRNTQERNGHKEVNFMK